MSHAHTIHTIRFIIGIIGNITSFGLFFSPAPTFLRIIKKKSVEDFHPFPYLAAILNCAFWIFYALPFNHPDSTLVYTINGIGLLFELIYVSIFLWYTDYKMRVKVGVCLLLEAIFFGGMALIDLAVFHTHAKRTNFIGILCVIFGIILYASPLSIMKKVIQTKSAEFLPFWLCLAGFLNGIIWAIYALLQFDPFILISNGVGGVLGISQLVLWSVYRPKDGENDKEVELKRVSV